MPKRVKKRKTSPSTGKRMSSDLSRQGRQVVKSPEGAVDLFGSHIVGRIARFLTDYIVLPSTTALVISAWVVAAWLIDSWDRFPHLAISSPEKRCGKTTLLELLFQIVFRPRLTTNISPAALYRVIESEQPTLLMDESQSLARRGSEQSEVTREILNAGIGRHAKVIRCGGSNMDEVREFSVFGPKVFAMIGQSDAVLADRSICVQLRRKTPDDPTVKRFRWRNVEQEGHEIRQQIEQWTEEHSQQVADVYDRIEPFEIDNDRMADLLTPLQAVLEVLQATEQLAMLEEFARSIDERDREEDMQSDGVRLLIAIRDIFESKKSSAHSGFIPTENLRLELENRVDEPWKTFTRGGLISREKLAAMLRAYGITPSRTDRKKSGRTRTIRGYNRKDFIESWNRYCPRPTPETT